MHEQRIRSDLAEDLRLAMSGARGGRSEPDAPLDIVVFGGAGDLSWRKLLPALFMAHLHGSLAAGTRIVGVGRHDWGREDYVRFIDAHAGQKVVADQASADAWRGFLGLLDFVNLDVTDAAAYARLSAACRTGSRRVYYLATAPSLFAPIAAHLSAGGLVDPQSRIVLEKPLGHDLASAHAINDAFAQHFDEHQIFRIDHYLGKETVQNILAFRFGNGIFEPLWNRRYVSHVQITAAESIGVEGRGAYYQEAGALRDMIQNHLLQVMATMAMEPPAAYEPDAVRDERAKLLRAVRVWKPEEVGLNAVAGQYGAARIGGEMVPGFREEPGVSPDARTDTYAAVTLEVDNWRWAGVPFYIRTGKRMPKRVTDVAIQFNRAPLALFEAGAGEMQQSYPNLLVLRIQPAEGISLRFFSKLPGSGMRLRPVTMDFNYGSSFGARSPSAYETLLLDALQGDATLYTRQDMVDASWAVVAPVLDHWAEAPHEFPNYAAGTWGPEASDRMLARRGHTWRVP